MNYQKVADEILKGIGGKNNIAHLEHCSTRLRITLKNDGLANIEAIEKIDGVIGVRQNVQCQIIIGNNVVEVYDALVALVGSDTSSMPNDIPTKKKKIGAVLLDFLVSIFQPLVPAIAGGGILKSFLMLFAMVGILSDQSQTYKILDLIGSAPLYFLPLLVAVTTAKKLKVNELVAMSAVGTLLLPNLTAMLADGATLFTLPISNIAYASQVFPAILTVLFYALMEKFFTKYSFKAIRIFFVPMMSLLLTVPVALLILGPLGYNIGTVFASAIVFFYEHFGFIATGILAAILPFMVFTGMHKAMIPYALTALSKTDVEMLYMPASLAHNIAESGACFAVSMKTKDKKLKSTSFSAGISALFGITEPALYGVTIIHKKVLYSVMGASLIGGVFAGFFSLKAFVAVGPGLASMAMFTDKSNPMNLVWAFVTLGISFVAAFVFAIILFKDSTQKQENSAVLDGASKTAKAVTEQVTSPVQGKVIPMQEINDSVFSSGLVGKGLGIIPHSGVLLAPEKGVVSMVFDTKHALSMKLDNGADLLFHIGIDTVQMEGDGFEVKVEAGDIVYRGDELVRFDIDKIKAKGLDPTVIFVVSNQENYDIVTFKENEEVTCEDIILEIKPVI